MKINFKIFIGILLTGIYLLVQLLLINDYGISWDFHYHNLAGLYHLGQKVPDITDESSIPFTPPDPRLTVLDPFGPFTQVLPSLSYLIFFEKLHLLPFASAYNLPGVLFGSLGIFILFLFLYESINFPVALFSAVFLALLPSHFGYLHNNMKDVPNAFAFALSIYLFWRLVKHGRVMDLVFAVLSFAFAFNVKINSVMIPVVCLSWFILFFHNSPSSPSYLKRGLGGVKFTVLYFILSPLAALLIWWPFWKEPIGKLLELPYFYSHNTLNMPVLLFGKIFRSGINIPWIYPWAYIFITTPIGILISFLVGIIISMGKIVKKNGIYTLLLLWFFMPLFRYFMPKVSAIDGVRHFMEIIYPMCAISGVGFYAIYQKAIKITKYKYAGLATFAILVSFLIFNIIKFHPFQTSFYNGFIGGVKGADGKFDIDFWGSPQKSAMLWLNKNAPFGSYVNIVMAQSSAAMYARDDIQERINKKGIEESDYVLILNKKSFFALYPVEDFLTKSIKEKKIVNSSEIDSTPLYWIVKN